VERDQVGDDALDERESTIGFSEAKVFARHGTNLDAQTHERLDAQTRERLDAQTRRRTGENSGSQQVYLFTQPILPCASVRLVV